jgi:hypothetical protein
MNPRHVRENLRLLKNENRRANLAVLGGKTSTMVALGRRPELPYVDQALKEGKNQQRGSHPELPEQRGDVFESPDGVDVRIHEPERKCHCPEAHGCQSQEDMVSQD